MNKIGLYVHVPFCDGKCYYCDFYSLRGNAERMDRYVRAAAEALRAGAEKYRRQADTLYFGGGTPNLLGARRLLSLLAEARRGFLLEDAEITVEANPARDLEDFLFQAREGGVNRLSLGLQSADDGELKLLGRRHTSGDVGEAVEAARRAGFQNISLDLMLGIPGQTRESLRRSVEFCARLEAEHVSAYLLKLEEGTAFFRDRDSLRLPDEEETRELYLLACRELEKYGYDQYEISNFSRRGFESRHNLKYWHCEEYLGVGPAAHSFLNGSRFYYPRDLSAFFRGEPPAEDGAGGTPEEYVMLALRLTEGLTERGYRSRFGGEIPGEYRRRAEKFRGRGLLEADGDGIRLTREGFLVSNALIGEILFG